ncbi:hypothetical protein D3C74_50160 [compost metagenome]
MLTLDRCPKIQYTILVSSTEAQKEMLKLLHNVTVICSQCEKVIGEVPQDQAPPEGSQVLCKECHDAEYGPKSISVAPRMTMSKVLYEKIENNILGLMEIFKRKRMDTEKRNRLVTKLRLWHWNLDNQYYNYDWED